MKITSLFLSILCNFVPFLNFVHYRILSIFHCCPFFIFVQFTILSIFHFCSFFIFVYFSILSDFVSLILIRFFRLLDDTYTIEEIEDILRDIREIVQLEAESELINAAHTNVLLLHQIFGQAQKWHLDLDANLADLENRDLLDQVKRWEDSECISGTVEDSKPLVQKKLAPLNEGGPMQLLKIQIEQANEENQMLRNRLKEVEKKAIGNVQLYKCVPCVHF